MKTDRPNVILLERIDYETKIVENDGIMGLRDAYDYDGARHVRGGEGVQQRGGVIGGAHVRS